jgi:hypothetical protein
MGPMGPRDTEDEWLTHFIDFASRARRGFAIIPRIKLITAPSKAAVSSH